MNAKCLITIGLMFAGSFATMAQKHTPPDPEAMAKRTVERMTQQLTLDKPAQDSLTAIYKDFYVQMDQRIKNGDREALKPLSVKRDERIKKVLTPEQYAKYLKETEKRRAMRPERPKGQGNDGEKGERREEPHQ
jgi:Spy/CpxP family protein refolding chaperone